RSLEVSYGDIHALHGVSFEVSQGELVSIIGANGAAKSSLLNAIMGITPLAGGSIWYQGKDISALPSHERARQGIRMVPERARVFPILTVYENLLAGGYRRPKNKAFEEKLEWLYSLFPVLAERRTQLAATLSGGEQQMLAIARALIAEPSILLVDEVSMGLMPALVDKVFEVLQQLNRDHGLTILLVEQNASASLRISTRGYVLETGTLVLTGTAAALLADERVRSAYLGI
ncbi:MAG: ABC transporter ATP-binding protein, partial [Rectinemataceae bacterium]